MNELSTKIDRSAAEAHMDFAPFIIRGQVIEDAEVVHRSRDLGVDFATPNMRIFTATLESSGWSGEAHGFAGVDYTITPRLALTAESRYIWGRSALASESFSGFSPIDLSGIGVTAGLSVRF